ncbi:L-idonate 5-dehydrogenase [Pseudoprimorskyibacter insulae]|uniref:L-idonate 5-dehydrogenase (NAD(P)(+)) n=1 Tax=Pseudoprimorskyibacter insulae TaxID=1695997 RepID=A0A2R8B0F6_9RHOB|nr:L-idonate 5-dehydrogenase [Pseudoprimorskyibacter insulae]SPF81772.1 L-idonate 5-dehydrogenase (NAD(P)(+)) [Pseudoprimorskyibacter insulae]
MTTTRVCRLYGQNDLRIETEEVAAPGPGQVMVAIAAGGICGSDMHYLSDGGIGTIRVREPIILGHEASGRVVAVGEGVTGLTPGDGVAINPSRPCGTCGYCTEGLPMHCLTMRFNGSAIRLPHEQGLFRDHLVLPATQCIKVPDSADLHAVACAEPLAVCLHAARMAGEIAGKRVLVTGAGPIGILCVAAAAAAGAAEIVVTDLQDAVLEVARQMGATRTINVARDGAEMARYAADKGYFHLAFECSAAGPAIASAVASLRPRGVLVQVGVTGDTPVPINALVAKEIQFQGTHRFHEEFAEAVEAIVSGKINVAPIVTGRYPLEEAEAAFKAAADRSKSVKVHLEFNA